ncbi:MAG: carbon starvation protein A, partial [Prevotellaceae bacterium]|nr:carbon starvation protein A [Prevotellaceae bacterium]
FGSIGGLQEFVSGLAPNENKAAVVVDLISKEWLGALGGLLALLGVIAAPITSGDTALRSARLIAADFLKFDQQTIKNRLIISIPIFALSFLILQINFDILWRYFAWCNQTLAVFTLWAITVYLARNRKMYWITLIPALFMTAVCTAYILISPEGFGLSALVSYITASVVCLSTFALFAVKKKVFNG